MIAEPYRRRSPPVREPLEDFGAIRDDLGDLPHSDDLRAWETLARDR